MDQKIDLTLATADQMEAFLCHQLAQIRLYRNVSQQKVAFEAGVSLKTIGRMERGEGVSLETFIRVMKALDVAENLRILLPDPTIRPMELVQRRPAERKRSRKLAKTAESSRWTWKDEKDT